MILVNNTTINHFDASLAEEIGLSESIVILKLDALVERERAETTDITLDTINATVSGLARKFFYFWHRTTLNRCMNNLEERGLIEIEKGTGMIRVVYENLANLNSISLRDYDAHPPVQIAHPRRAPVQFAHPPVQIAHSKIGVDLAEIGGDSTVYGTFIKGDNGGVQNALQYYINIFSNNNIITETHRSELRTLDEWNKFATSMCNVCRRISILLMSEDDKEIIDTLLLTGASSQVIEAAYSMADDGYWKNSFRGSNGRYPYPKDIAATYLEAVDWWDHHNQETNSKSGFTDSVSAEM